MAKNDNTSTSTQTTTPYPAAQPNIDMAMKDARTLYKSGVGSQPYMGSTVIPYSQQSQAGMDSIQNQAQANMGGQGLSGQAQQIIDNGGYNADQMQSMAYLNNVGTNPFDLSQNAAYQNYKNSSLNDISDRVNAAASAAGRYGSFDHYDSQVGALNDAGSAMDMQQFGRMDNLNSQRFNAGQTGMGNLGSAYSLGQLPANSMMDIGSMYEDLAGRLKNDELRIFDGIQNAPWKNLGNLMAVTGGAGQYGTSQTQAQQPGRSPLLTGLGAAATLAGAL